MKKNVTILNTGRLYEFAQLKKKWLMIYILYTHTHICIT